MNKCEGGSYASSRFLPAALGKRGRAPAGTEKGGSISLSAASLLWVLELQRSKMLRPGLLFKVIGQLHRPSPKQAVDSQSKGF